MNKGLIHIYTGDGKGKTTATTGLAVRFAGTGGRVLFCRFLKTNDSGELEILKNIPEIKLTDNPKVFHMIRLKEGKIPEGAAQYYKDVFDKAVKEAEGGGYGLLIMDELIGAVNLGFINVKDVLDFLKSRPDSLEVAMTGRNPAPELIKAADYVSEIKKIKHPYDEGIKARKGIEF